MFTFSNKFRVSFLSRLDQSLGSGSNTSPYASWPYKPGKAPDFKTSMTPPITVPTIPLPKVDDLFGSGLRHTLSDVGAQSFIKIMQVSSRVRNAVGRI